MLVAFAGTVAHVASGATIGIDVSEYQGHIDWEALRDSGTAAFSIAKATEGRNLIDAEFRRNWREMRANNFPVRGAYHFARPSHDPKDAVLQASAFVNTVEGFHDGEFAVLDIESDFVDDENDSNSGAIDADALVSWCFSWTSAVMGATGLPPHRVVIYTGAWFWDSHTIQGDARDALAARHPLWFSSYTQKPVMPQGWPTWLLWPLPCAA